MHQKQKGRQISISDRSDEPINIVMTPKTANAVEKPRGAESSRLRPSEPANSF